jgi:DNA-binding transcriptional LysR family regulator
VELRQLVYFDAVVRHGGFTRASEQLHVAQPGISAQIRQLEVELGVVLLARTTRQVRLTDAGQRFLTRTRRILDELDAGRADMAQLTGVLTGRVRIGTVEALDPLDLPGALAALHDRHPGVEVILRPSPVGQQLLNDLDAYEIDLALGPTPPGLPGRFAALPLFSEELVVVAGADHHLNTHRGVSFSALREERFVSFPPGTGLRRILDTAAVAADFVPRVPYESTSLTQIRDLVSHGLGIALVPASVATAPGRPVTTHSVQPNPIQRAIALTHRRDPPLPAAAQAARDLLQRWPTATAKRRR